MEYRNSKEYIHEISFEVLPLDFVCIKPYIFIDLILKKSLKKKKTGLFPFKDPLDPPGAKPIRHLGPMVVALGGLQLQMLGSKAEVLLDGAVLAFGVVFGALDVS